MYIKDRKRIISCAVTAVMLVLLFGDALGGIVAQSRQEETWPE